MFSDNFTSFLRWMAELVFLCIFVLAVIGEVLKKLRDLVDHWIVFYYIAKKNFLMELGKEEVPVSTKVKNLSGVM
jgi:hypothetical protein